MSNSLPTSYQQYIHTSRYARFIEDKGRRETWSETVERYFDFMENPSRKFFRLAPGKEVRLRYAFFITCTDVVKNDLGEVIELKCTYDPKSKGGKSPDGRKVKGTLHWVSAVNALNAEIKVYDRLFQNEDPSRQEDFLNGLNPDSCKIFRDAKIEKSLQDSSDQTYQFERLGYFKKDSKLKGTEKNIYIRVVSLRDTWAKLNKK